MTFTDMFVQDVKSISQYACNSQRLREPAFLAGPCLTGLNGPCSFLDRWDRLLEANLNKSRATARCRTQILQCTRRHAKRTPNVFTRRKSTYALCLIYVLVCPVAARALVAFSSCLRTSHRKHFGVPDGNNIVSFRALYPNKRFVFSSLRVKKNNPLEVVSRDRSLLSMTVL
jgi:hypothetical protein